MHPLADILAAGGGDCGSLTSIYVSLLRHRGIPARHLAAVRPGGSYHVWADFLVQGYGWVWLARDIGGSTMELTLLQNYAWWFWSSTSSSVVTTSYALAAASL